MSKIVEARKQRLLFEYTDDSDLWGRIATRACLMLRGVMLFIHAVSTRSVQHRARNGKFSKAATFVFSSRICPAAP